MSVPNKKTTSSEHKLLQHQRWFRRGEKWQTGSGGRISMLKLVWKACGDGQGWA
jgi:hypothetical protein